MSDILKSPFPYFGGKRKIAELVWSRFGNVLNYVEPFFGSGAMLLARPKSEIFIETVNDFDGLLANFWRALRADPDAVAHHADWPVNENDLHARHMWLVERKDSLQARLEGDPDYFDAKMAGWWVWGMACWIGSGFCSGSGPWQIAEVDGARQLVHVGNNGQGNESETRSDLLAYFRDLAARLRNVRVCCGDWSRVCGPSVTSKHGLTAVFLDPPYADTAKRASGLYRKDCERVAHAVREWAITEGENSLMRIALAGYEGEHQMPESWQCVEWNAGAGFGGQNQDGITGNGSKERIWFSPYCLGAMEPELF